MLRLTLAQMRRSAGRLAAAGVAIMIGTAFVAVTLLAGSAVEQTTTSVLAAQFARADLVASSATLGTAQLDAVRAVPGVTAADGQRMFRQEFSHGGRHLFPALLPMTSDPALLPVTVAEGTLPTSDDQVALPADIADRLGLELGDSVEMLQNVQVVAGNSVETRLVPVELTLTGTTDDPAGAFASSGGAGVVTAASFEATFHQGITLRHVTAAEFDALTPEQQRAAIIAEIPQEAGFTSLLLRTDGPVTDALRQDVAAALTAVDPAAAEGLELMTPQEMSRVMTEQISGGQDIVVTVFSGVFAAIALLVAGLVIANTFQVLVAQRTRTLALLRCVGAAKSQLRRSVLVEAFAVGILASAAGVALGALLGQTALAVGRAMDLGIPLPATITVTPAVVLVPVVAGTVVTVLAALSPARGATRVAPLEALRPADAPTIHSTAGRARLALSALLTLGGFGLLGLGMWQSAQSNMLDTGVLIAVAGGALSFVGVVIGGVFWLPKVTALAGRLAGLSGPTARLAAANTSRNPRRTAATSTALVIGVTLVAMMSTGAASARATLNAELNDRYFVDALVATDRWTTPENATALDTQVTTAVRAVDGVATVVEIPSGRIEVTGDTTGVHTLDVRGITPADADAVGRSAALGEGIGPGTLALSRAWWSEIFTDGEQVQVTGTDGSRTLTVRLTDLRGQRASFALVEPQVLAELSPHAPVTQLWVALEDPSDAVTVVPRIEDALGDTSSAASLDGAAVERATIDSVINTMLAVVVGLLAAAVVIALIGVANTLSLSVIERQKESATLRAIGLSRGRLRGMLAIEGVLIAVVGAVCGVALGLAYGWAGSQAILSQTGGAVLAVPWRDIAIAIVVALGAGLLASVVPGRTAARTSPIEALATD